MAYATASDLTRRWRLMTAEETERAEQLLEDAAVMLGWYEQRGTSLDILSIVSCSMVRRAMTERGDAFGYGQEPDPLMYQSSTPTGELYLTSQERKMLRGGSRIGTVQMEA